MLSFNRRTQSRDAKVKVNMQRVKQVSIFFRRLFLSKMQFATSGYSQPARNVMEPPHDHLPSLYYISTDSSVYLNESIHEDIIALSTSLGCRLCCKLKTTYLTSLDLDRKVPIIGTWILFV